MQCTRKVTDGIYWVGANDRRLAKFENMFPIPRGVSYNSYVILDGKTALMDTADSSVAERFMENVAAVLTDGHLTIWWYNTWSRITVPISQPSLRSIQTLPLWGTPRRCR